MKHFSLIFTLILAGCFSIAAQSEVNKCPEVTVSGPSGVTRVGDTMTFVANVNSDDADKLGYERSVSAGTIEEGKGTSSIVVRTTKEMNDVSVTATVNITGLSEGCNATASEGGSVSAGCGLISPIDEFGRFSKNDTRARIDNFLIRLKHDPDSIGLIVIKLNERESRALKLAFINNIRDALALRKFDPKRIEYVISKGPYETSATLWLMPDAADRKGLTDGVEPTQGEKLNQRLKELFPGRN
jgi:hypothetical protein